MLTAGVARAADRVLFGDRRRAAHVHSHGFGVVVVEELLVGAAGGPV